MSSGTLQQKLSKRLQATVPRTEAPPIGPRSSAEVREYGGLLRQAAEFQYAGNLHKAAKTLRQALRLLPEQPAAYQNMGVVLVHSGDREGACRNYLLAESRWSQHVAGWARSISSSTQLKGP